MLGAIPNPKKNVTIDFPLKKLKDTIVFIPLTRDKKYKFTSKNDVLNLYTFEATEFLSLGVYIDISLSEVSENRTSIEIEVRRKVGAFDQAHEVSNANQHITKILELISLCVNLTDEKIAKLNENATNINNQQKNNKGCSVLILLLLGSGATGLGLILFS
jgi:hypothetical protein